MFLSAYIGKEQLLGSCPLPPYLPSLPYPEGSTFSDEWSAWGIYTLPTCWQIHLLACLKTQQLSASESGVITLNWQIIMIACEPAPGTRKCWWVARVYTWHLPYSTSKQTSTVFPLLYDECIGPPCCFLIHLAQNLPKLQPLSYFLTTGFLLVINATHIFTC